MRNRFVEPNPTLSDGDLALTARPGMRRWQIVGTGPIRGMFSQPGAFSGDLFVMSGQVLYRIHADGTNTVVDDNFFGANNGALVKMACTGSVGTIPPYLYIADGQTLRVYTDQGFAKGQLHAPAGLAPVNQDTVQLDAVFYTFSNVTSGLPTDNDVVDTPYNTTVDVTTTVSYTYNAVTFVTVQTTNTVTTTVNTSPPAGTGGAAVTTETNSTTTNADGSTVVTNTTTTTTPATWTMVETDNEVYTYSDTNAPPAGGTTTTSTTSTSAPDGSVLFPWIVFNPGTAAQALDELMLAINATGTPGADYSSGLTLPNAIITAYQNISTGLYVHAQTPGATGNGYVTATGGSGHLAFLDTHLDGGGTPSCTPVAVPNGVGVYGVGYVNSYIIVLPVPDGTDVINGQFYWIEPGYTTIDPLDYATAERSPDGINDIMIFNDQYWLCGQDTIEVWFTSADPNAPMQPIKGITIDRGIMQGSAVHIKDKAIVVDQDGGVFGISTAQPERISTPDIEERLRVAILYMNTRIANATL